MLLRTLIDVAALLSFLWGVAAIVLAVRVWWLRGMGRAPRAPTPGRFLLGAGWGFVFSGQHREIGDRLTSYLVLASRVLILSAAVLMISAFAVVSAEERSPNRVQEPKPSLATPARPGPHEGEDAFQRNEWVLDALSSGDFQAIVAHTAPEMRSAQELTALRSATSVIPREQWTSSWMLANDRTFPDGVVTVHMSVKYSYPSSKNVILDTTFKYSSDVPELVQLNLQPTN